MSVIPPNQRLGAVGSEAGLYVRFEPGFGLNVYIGMRSQNYFDRSYSDDDKRELGMSIIGWERLAELVDEYRALQENATGA